MGYRQQLTKFVPVVIVVLVFARSLVIDRAAGSQPVTAIDAAFMLPLVAYFWPLLVVFRLTEDSYTYLSREDKRSYSLLIIGLTAILFFMWVMVLLNSRVPLFTALSTSTAFALGLYDLLKLIYGLQKVSELRRIVWLQFALPFGAAAGLYILTMTCTHWQQVPNPLAVFFILRACLAAIRKPATVAVS